MKGDRQRHEYRLYIAGATPRSLLAVQNIKRICDACLPGRYHLEVVDIFKHPNRATEDQIIAVPTLIRRTPGGARRLIGDLSKESRVRKELGLAYA